MKKVDITNINTVMTTAIKVSINKKDTNEITKFTPRATISNI